MANTKPLEEATQDFATDLAALRDDISRLTDSVSELVRAQASATTKTMLGVVDTAREKIASKASEAQDRVSAASADVEARIERNPLMAVFIAAMAGLLIGMLCRPRK